MEPKLCREVCKHCWNSHCDSEGRGGSWVGHDDLLWTRGVGWCQVERNWIFLERLPDDCLYRFEHIVMGGNNGETQ